MIRLCRARSHTLAVALFVSLGATALHGQGHEKLAGRRLSDALDILQRSGLRIVFSSELVTSDMWVGREPRAKNARGRLVELLEPHDLGARDGPDETIVVIRKPRTNPVRPPPPDADPPPIVPESEQGSPDLSKEVFRTEVTVVTDPPREAELFVGSSRRLGVDQLLQLGSRVVDDPIGTLQTLPTVATSSDFRSEISVRGSAYRHAAVVVEGFQAPWLHHTAVGRPDAGSLTMIRSDVLQEAALNVGAYARRDGSQLGPQVDLTLREGSRDVRRFDAGAGTFAATWTGEGPLGRARRGSWIVGLRKSYTEWPLRRDDHDGTVFGVGDLQSKLVYDVRPNRQVSASVIAGVSNVERDDPTTSALWDGVNRAVLATVGFRSAFGDRTVVDQRASVQAHSFENRNQAYDVVGRGVEHSGAYRADVRRAFRQSALEAGVLLQRTRASIPERVLVVSEEATRATSLAGLSAAWWERSSYVSLRWSASADLVVVSGVRFAGSTLQRQRAIDRWIQAEWTDSGQWRIAASAGVAHQLAKLEGLAGSAASIHRPERASYFDAGIGRSIARGIRLNATAFVRRERDIHPDDFWSRLRPTSGLSGTARGIDLVVERLASSGLTGWIGYTFAVARYTDPVSHETYRVDHDQQHLITLSGFAPLDANSRIGLTFRAGSNAPIPGYFVERDGNLFVGSRPNRVARPAYARLDVRAERRFAVGESVVVAFAELVNALDHDNYGVANGVVLDTGRALGVTERLFSRLLTGGLRVEF